MKIYLRLIAATALAGAATFASPASAARLFDFSYTGVDVVTGAGIFTSGQLTTTDAPSRGSLTITGITGQRNDATINRLFPAGTVVDATTGDAIDNRLFTSMPFLTFNGFGFGTVGSDAVFNPFFLDDEYQEFVSVNGAGVALQIIDFRLAEVSGAIPEPGTWAMMLVGFGAIGYAMRRRPKTSVTVRFA